MEVTRGDVVTIALPGDYGKPRPALVVQSDAFSALDSVTVLRLTSAIRDFPLFRITVEPSAGNGLARRSQIMVDKAATVPRAKIGQRVGRLEPDRMLAVNTAMAKFLGL
jgi:mRNA interferase MazF